MECRLSYCILLLRRPGLSNCGEPGVTAGAMGSSSCQGVHILLVHKVHTQHTRCAPLGVLVDTLIIGVFGEVPKLIDDPQRGVMQHVCPRPVATYVTTHDHSANETNSWYLRALVGAGAGLRIACTEPDRDQSTRRYHIPGEHMAQGCCTSFCNE